MQGVRIDYALLSPGLLEHVVSCEVISTLPPKWSDHAAVMLELADIPAVPKHPPCALSSKRIKRFQPPKTSVAALFAKKRAAQTAAAAPIGSDAGAGETTTGSKRLRAAKGASAADAASPSNVVQDRLEEEALPEAGRGHDARSSAGNGVGCGRDAVIADEQRGTGKDGAAEASGSTMRDGVENSEICPVERDVAGVEEEKRSVAAEKNQSQGLTAVRSRTPASTNLRGNQQRSIRAFFSVGDKS